MALPPPNPDDFPPVPQFQAIAYRNLMKNAFRPDSLSDTIMKRTRDLFDPHSVTNTGIDVTLALSILKRRLRKHEAMRVIKTWVNSWATSTRFHENFILRCLFGYQDAEDRMSHYVLCPFWYYLLVKLTPDSESTLPRVSQMPLTRMGLVEHPRAH